MKGFVPSNYGIYEYKPGLVTQTDKTPLENQRYFVIINVPISGQWILSPVNGLYEKNGEDEKVFALESRVQGQKIRDAEAKIKKKVFEQEEAQGSHQSNKERKAGRQSFKEKHGKGSNRKAKKEKKKWEEREVNKNKQNKTNARKIREYTK